MYVDCYQAATVYFEFSGLAEWSVLFLGLFLGLAFHGDLLVCWCLCSAYPTTVACQGAHAIRDTVRISAFQLSLNGAEQQR